MIERHKLGNGIRVVAQNKLDSFSTSIMVIVKTGSRNETLETNGISHFIEHMTFKGTKKRPTAIIVSKEVDSMGAERNAGTDKELTEYYIRIDKNNFEQALDILNDTVFHSVFSEKEVKKEQGAIIEEINMYEDNPSSLVFDLYDRIIHDNGQMARDILGTKEVVMNLDSKELINYHTRHYRSDNVMVVCVGALPRNYLALIEKYFSDVNPGETSYLKATSNPLFQKRVYLKNKSTEQAHIIIGTEAFPKNLVDKYALRILTTLLGGYSSSRLYTEIREKRGIAYHIHAFTERGFDSDAFMVEAGVNVLRTEEAVRIIRDELLGISQSILEEEIIRAKNNINGKMALREEDTLSMADRIGRTEIFGEKALLLDERVREYEKVTLEDVKRVAGNLFKPENLKLAVIGPFKDEEKFVKILGS